MSDDSAIDKDLPPSGQPSAPEAPAPAPAADEVEYVYEDEHGNKVAPPEGGFDPNEYEEEVVEVPVDAGEPPAASSDAGAAAAGAAPTQALKTTGSGRRTSDRKSGRQPKPLTPEELKKVRRKVILLLGLISLIPILGIALIFMLYKKGHIFPQKPTTRVVENDFAQGDKIYGEASPHYKKANALYEQGQRAASYTEYKLAEKDLSAAQVKVANWVKGQDLSQYAQVEALSRQINIDLRHVRERMIMLEASGDTGAPKPPPPPPPPAVPE